MRRQSPLTTVAITAMCVAFVFAGFRNLPRLSHPQSSAAGLVLAGCVYAAYRIGCRRARDGAMAIATARAEATAVAAVHADTKSAATSNVIVINSPELGATAAGRHLGLEDAPWMVGAQRSVELDETEALDIALEDVMAEQREEA